MKNSIWIYIVVILVIILAVIGIIYVKNNKDSDNNKIEQEISKNENNFAKEENVNKNEMINERDEEKTKNEISSVQKSLVLYFSATNNTEQIAKYIKEVTNSDIIEITPKEEYTSNDLNYNNNNSRANKEQNDDKARPEIANTDLELDDYEVIYLGYPIWWGKEPKIILTLLDNYNLEGKTIIPFCTSGSSEIETSIKDLRKYNSKLNILDGKRFSSSVSEADVENWINSIK